jgi:hypothetical protein
MKKQTKTQQMVEALEASASLIKTARQYFPTSIRHRDTWKLELTCATVGSALHRVKGKSKA